MNRINHTMSPVSAMVDLTAPESGTVTDGDPDMVYSSETAVIEVAWAGFADPESGHESVDWQIYRKKQGKLRNEYGQTYMQLR